VARALLPANFFAAEFARWNADYKRHVFMILCAKWCAAWAAATVLLPATALLARQTQKSNDPQRACDEAKSQMELNQCAGEQYHKADARLNSVYRKALETMQKDLSDAQDHKNPDLIKYNQQSIEKLKAAERAWIQYRDFHCEAARHQFEGGSMSPMIWGFCMAQTTLDRIDEMKSAYEDGDRKLE
jgi:uncharacterized protein YecT (DUF1311 family)